jgi:histone-lysine N-methyltransferase SETMAR
VFEKRVSELDISGIVHYEFLLTGQQSTKFTIWISWILHHDNAPAHTALSLREFLATKQITVLEHPTYSPDLAPFNFFLFPKIKEILKGRHFDVIVDIRSNTTAALKAFSQNQFQNCF